MASGARGREKRKRSLNIFFEFLRFKKVFFSLSNVESRVFFRKEGSVGGGGLSFPIPEMCTGGEKKVSLSEVAPKQLVTKGFSPPPFSRNQIPGKRLVENSFIPSVPHHRNIREKSFFVFVFWAKR